MIKKVILLEVTVALIASWSLATGAPEQSETSVVTAMQFVAPPDEYTLDSAQAVFDRRYKARQYGEATEAGKMVVKWVLAQQNRDPETWSKALTQLASAQQKDGQYAVAMQNYRAAIEMLEADSDRLNKRLVDPLWGLSRTYVDTGQLNMALTTYKKTLHLTHVNSGIYNSRQSKLLEEMSEIWFKLGEYAKADAMQLCNVNLAKHNHPGNSLLKLPAMYGRAHMLTRSGKYLKSQRSYREILRLVQKAEGPKSLILLPVLYKLSNPALYDKSDDDFSAGNTILHYLRQAVRIAKKNEAATPVQKADAYLAMGDFVALKIGDRGLALSSYHKAWDLLSEDAALRAERDNRFAEPVALNDIPSYSTATFWGLQEHPRDNDKDGVVIVSYDITRKGSIENMRVAESDPAGYRDYDVIKHLRNIMFRPSFDARKPTASLNRRYEVRYTYRDKELPRSIRETLVNDVALSLQQ